MNDTLSEFYRSNNFKVTFRGGTTLNPDECDQLALQVRSVDWMLDHGKEKLQIHFNPIVGSNLISILKKPGDIGIDVDLMSPDGNTTSHVCCGIYRVGLIAPTTLTYESPIDVKLVVGVIFDEVE